MAIGLFFTAIAYLVVKSIPYIAVLIVLFLMFELVKTFFKSIKSKKKTVRELSEQDKIFAKFDPTYEGYCRYQKEVPMKDRQVLSVSRFCEKVRYAKGQ